MYRLILVDDEAIVREGISRCLPWGTNGFEIAGLFDRGQPALDYIENNSVDIVITDINMPRMDGLTLSRILMERYPKIMVLLLTGYDAFEYALGAVKNQVREFLLKPITAEELSRVLERIKEELDFSREKARQQALLEEKLSRSFPILRERFLYRLVSGHLPAEGISRRRSYFQWIDHGAFYQVAVLSIPESWNEMEFLILSEYLKGLMKPGDEVFSNREEDIVLLLQGQDAAELEGRAKGTAEKAFLHASRLKGDHLSAGYGEVVDSPVSLHSSYRGARTALDYSRVLGLSQILSIHDVRDRKRISLDGFNTLARALMVQLRSGSLRDCEKALSAVFSFLEAHYLTLSEASRYLTRLHFLLVSFLQEMDLFTLGEEDPILHPPGNFGSLNQAGTYFFKVLQRIDERVQSRRQDLLLSRLDKAREIIARRYGDSQFSLKDICDELYLSTSQFSLLFKEGVGQTFVEYLTAHRVEQAKNLLKSTNLRGYEVAERTGFSDPRYFSLVFKKLTGLTAREYRRGLEA